MRLVIDHHVGIVIKTVSAFTRSRYYSVPFTVPVDGDLRADLSSARAFPGGGVRLFSHSSISVDAVRWRFPGESLVKDGHGISSRLVEIVNFAGAAEA